MTPPLASADLELAPIEGTPRAKPAAEGGVPQQGRRWSDGLRGMAADPNAPWSMAHHWPELVASLSEQAVDSSNLLLRALDFLVGAGRLRRNEAQALADAMVQLRETSLRAQQVTRLAGGRIRQARERVELMQVIRGVLDERDTDFVAAGVQVSANLSPVDVLLDPPVAVSLFNSIIDWGLTFGREVLLTLQPVQWPQPARLQVRVGVRPREETATDASGAVWGPRHRGRRLNDGLHWMLLRQMASSAGLEVTRTRDGSATILNIEFPKTFQSTEGLACMELTDADAGASRGSWVLIVTGDQVLQEQSIRALHRTGIEARAANDLRHARALVQEHKPSLIVTGFDIAIDEVTAFRTTVLGDTSCPVVEVLRDTPKFHINGFDGFETAKVGRDQLDQELPATVLFEMVKLS